MHNVKERQAEPLQLRELTQLDGWFGQALAAARAQGDRALGLRLSRDRALILLGFWKGFRGDDLLRLQIEHLTIVPGQGMTLYLPRSKGDRQARGTIHQLPALSRLCPVTAVQAWCEVAALSEGPLFRAVDTGGAVRARALHANSLIGVLRRAFARAGIAAAETYSGHSLRRGFAGWATGNGWDAKALMEYVSWKDVQSAMRYVDRPSAIKKGLLHYIVGARFLVLITAPVIYSPIVPFMLLDLFTTIYQHVCFVVYGIPRVKRKDYVIFDRRYLAYLNFIEKINCAYCSYANGVVAYVREVGSRTEQYWCPIKHARRLLGAHPRYAHFVAYGDAQGYRDELEALRSELRKAPNV